MAKTYRIHPAIGVARVGNSQEHFVGPEVPGVPAAPPDGMFKENGRIKRMAARFRIFEYDDGGAAPTEINLDTANVASIEWTVHLANRKAVWFRFAGRTGETSEYPADSLRNKEPKPSDESDVESGGRRAKWVIDPGPRTISAQKAAAPPQQEIAKGLSSDPPGEAWPPSLKPAGNDIESLGTLYTDEAGRLKVAGGYGKAGTAGSLPTPGKDIDWVNNPGWFDDVSDGSVQAKISFTDGTPAIIPAAAWLVVALPDFAPPVQSVVTLFDVLYDLGVRTFSHAPALFDGGAFRAGAQGYTPSYTKEIFPILRRALTQRSVAPDVKHEVLLNNPKLGKLLAGDPGKQARAAIFSRINNPDAPKKLKAPALPMPPLHSDDYNQDVTDPFTLTRTQYFLLSQWKDGFFLGDWNGAPAAPDPLAISAHGLDVAAVENCAGGAFYPGMEVGWAVRDRSIFDVDSGPGGLRIHVNLGPPDARGLRPGDLTKRMALPWQADFDACAYSDLLGISWWPAQRPTHVRQKGSVEEVKWDEGIVNHLDMTLNWYKLGFIKGDPHAPNPAFFEDERNIPR